jgi:hypothetical protein
MDDPFGLPLCPGHTSFPKLLTKKLTKHELKVQFKFIQVFSSVTTGKPFDSNEFFQTYSSSLRNPKKTKRKEYFIQFIEMFEKYR